LVAAGYAGALARVAAEDSFVPLGNAATLVLVTESDIEGAIRAIVTEHRPDSGRA
jgi:2-oxoisovalerate dehydrogenase E1 component